jgi:hypothetical protein
MGGNAAGSVLGGHPVSPDTPQTGWALTFDGKEWIPTALATAASPTLSGAVTCTGTLTVDGVATAAAATAPTDLPQLGQLSPHETITSGALPTIGSWGSGTAQQNPAARDIDLYIPVTFTPTAGAAATCAVALSPDDTTFSTLFTETVPAGTALDSFIRGIHVRVPQGWWVKFTVANATLGTATYA